MKILVSLFFLKLIVFAFSKSKDCSPLPFVSLDNGQILPGRSKEGFRFTCDYGYFLIGPSEVRCWEGKWLPEEGHPQCLRSEGHCDPPRKIPNADIWGDQTEEGALVQYVCHQGYELIGKGIRTCEQSLTWSGITPACIEETESLKAIATRLQKDFIKNIGSYSDGGRGRSLDSDSLLKGLELVILTDRSSSIDPVDFKMGIDFIKFLLKEFGVKNGQNMEGTRAAVLTFGSEVEVVFNLDTASISDPEEASKVLDTLKADGGGTALEPALSMVVSEVLHLLRPEAKKALFLITDGEPNIGSVDFTPQEWASQLKRRSDFEIFAVGIGRDINRDLLAELASEPVRNHVFILNKYSDLKKIMDMIKALPTEKPVPGPSQCGYISTNPPSPLKWPWLAAIYVGYPKNDGNETSTRLSLCAGVLICKEWVLTAASCFYQKHGREVRFLPQEVFVTIGEDDLLKEEKWQKNYYAVSVISHPRFDPFNNLQNNIALVKLNKEVHFNITFRPICLPDPGEVIPLHRILTTNASSAGWGELPPEDLGIPTRKSMITTKLITESMNLAETGECLRAFNINASIHTFCATPDSTDCYETQGSPIMAKDPNSDLYQAIGVLPQKKDCKEDYSLYMEIRSYIPWINEITRSCTLQHALKSKRM